MNTLNSSFLTAPTHPVDSIMASPYPAVPSLQQPTLYQPHSHANILRLPADGSPPTIISVPTIDIRSERKSTGVVPNDLYLCYVPDLRPYWLDAFRTRRIQGMTVQKSDHSSLHGEYLTVYITHPDFPRNKTIADLLKPEIEEYIKSGERFLDRVFWRGDVFIMREGEARVYKQSNQEYPDMPGEMVQMPEFLKILFRHMFGRKILEQKEPEIRDDLISNQMFKQILKHVVEQGIELVKYD